MEMRESPLTADGPATIAGLLLAAAAGDGAKVGFSLDGEDVTDEEMAGRARKCAAALASLGLRPGDHVGLMAPNCSPYLELFFGAALGGFVPVTINSRYGAAELRYVIPHSDVRCLFTGSAPEADFLKTLKAAFADLDEAGAAQRLAGCEMLTHVFVIDGAPATAASGYEAFLAGAGAGAGAGDEDRASDAAAVMMYTSGTTSHPKACLLSNRSVVGNAYAMAARWEMGPDDVFYDPLPFFHMSTILPLVACLISGSRFVATRHFKVEDAIELLRRDTITVGFFSFPTITNAIIHHPEFNGAAVRNLRLINNVAPPATLEEMQSHFPNTVQVSAYGLTEAGGVVSFGAPSDGLRDRCETSGAPFPGIEVRIAEPDNPDRPVGRGEPGEIQIRGYCLFDGYYKDEAATEAAMTADGWLRTGDVGSLNADGAISYRGRIKDMLKVGGENVAALEIEAHLNAHPAIVLSQVIGVPDDRLGEAPAAFIETVNGEPLDPEEVIAHCKGQIARFKIPRYVVRVDVWPMSATKVQKFRLRELDLGPKLSV